MAHSRVPLRQSANRRRRILLALTWYSIAIHRGITRFAHDAGWVIDGGYVREGAMPSEHWTGSGVIAVMGVNDEVDRHVMSYGLPIVNIGYATPPGVARVAADSAAVGALAADHFLTRGFRNFAFYEADQRPGEVQRRDGFEQFLAARGFKSHRIGEPAARAAKNWTGRQDLDQILGKQLAALPKPVAVTAEYDDRAINVIDAALAAGLRVPEQVAVLGVDNDELRCPFAPVPLSSIDNDEELIGFEAARQLQLLMEGNPPPEKAVLVKPKRVVVRQSTNILAIAHDQVASALRMIWENYTEGIDSKRVASEIPLSYTQLHELFVKHVGHSMAEEIERRRVEHAQMLLASSDDKLSEIARKSGFGSADRMGRVFKRRLNLTPSDVRAKHLAGPDATLPPVEATRPDAIAPTARPAAYHDLQDVS
jgi:LacI family transcriptional regulator